MPLEFIIRLPPWGELTSVKVQGDRVREALLLDLHLFMVDGACSALNRLCHLRGME
jgi:hypothetical protein